MYLKKRLKHNIKNKKFRKNYNFFEKTKNLSKFLIYNDYFSFNFKFYLNFTIKKVNKKYSITQIKNRCIFTGRGRSILSKFKVSRHFFKRLVTEGRLYTYKKL